MAINVAVNCRPAGVKPTETIAFAIVAWWRPLPFHLVAGDLNRYRMFS